MFQSTHAVKTIFYINIAMFLLTLLSPGLMFPLFAMSDPYTGYQLISYQFMHSGFMHIFFNMLVFLSFAPAIEDLYGTTKMWIYYLSCGVVGALLQHYMIPNIPLVGASASIWGIMALYALLYPNQSMYLFLIPIAIKAKYIISVLLLFEFVQAYTSTDNVGHYAHIGGALTGGLIYFLNKYKIIK